MIRMEIALITVLIVIAIVYFSVEHQYTRPHRTFAILLITTMIHMVFDGATLYTVNHMDQVSEFLNAALHHLFVATMIFIGYLYFYYIRAVVEEEAEEDARKDPPAYVFLIVAEVSSMLTPMEYMCTDQGNYAIGTPAKICYISLAFYLLLCVVYVWRHKSIIDAKKKLVIGFTLFVEIFIMVGQLMHPTWLISGIGLTVMTLTLYLTMESPYIVQTELMQQKMSMLYLKSQVNPHFLYNTLDSIRIKAQLNDDKEVADLLMKLAAFFRFSIKVNAQMISLDDELSVLETYLDLMCYRYPNLRYEYEIEPGMEDMLIPNFTLQPLVENSLLHGLKNKGYNGKITICAKVSDEEPGCMEIQVKDTGSGFAAGREDFVNEMLTNYKQYAPQVDGDSIGILNVQKRVKLLCGKKCGLHYTENEGGGITAHLLITLDTGRRRESEKA